MFSIYCFLTIHGDITVFESCDGGTGKLEQSQTTSLSFAWYIQSSAKAYFCIWEGRTDHFERLCGGWDYRFKQNVLCHVTVYCVVLYCHTMCLCRVVHSRIVSRFIIVIRILKCMAANYVNKRKNLFYMIICNGPCDSRLDGAVNVIVLLT